MSLVCNFVLISVLAGCSSNPEVPSESGNAKGSGETVASFGIGVGSRTDVETGKVFSYAATSDGGVARLSGGVIDAEEFVAEQGPFTIPGSKETEHALNAMIHNLRVGYTKGPISPFGLTNDRFDFHMFWDADVWVFPALALTYPDVAKRVPEMRYGQRDGAWENFLNWRKEGYPGPDGAKHKPLPELVKIAGEVRPMMYPWETINGDELSPNPDTKFQHHVTGGVAWMMDRAIRLGLIDRAKGEEVIRGCAAFYLWRMDMNPDGSYGLRNVVSPDEWHTVDNDLYTNAIADWTIRRAFGEKVWPRGKVRFPRRGNTFATFDGDDYNEYQQAAALLAVFPLQHPDIEPEAEKMYALYRGKHSKNGPAMSAAIDAAVAARLGLSKEAGEDFGDSWQPYAFNPGLEFREKPGTGESYFLTGAAGCVNAAIYGIWGVRIQDEKPRTDQTAIKLDGGGWLTIRPNVPEEWGASTCVLTVNGKLLKLHRSSFDPPGGDFSAEYDGKPLRK